MARQNYFEFIKSMRFDAKKEIEIVKKILQEDIYIKNYKTNLQEFFSDGYKKYYPVEKKGQHVTFEEKFTVIYQRFTSVDCLYTVFYKGIHFPVTFTFADILYKVSKHYMSIL